ncbi:hypothetical protein EZS27_005398 [termite gut metagenome]|uniref:Uncharacterized protein n=1 Tax=termite gut metagenome TaxID=433724 RepID=A0A5J4SPT3_9ZZZZ
MNIKNNINRFWASIACKISPTFYLNLSYFHNRGRLPNLKNPTNLSEFIISKIVSGKINDYAQLADKYAVRSFVAEKGLSHILTKLYGHWDKVYQINFDELPDQFVLKCNFGCGMNVICFDKGQLDFQEVKSQLNSWMEITKFAVAEPHYSKIEKCIIGEELIKDEYFDLPTDYKFMCINGEPHHILVVSEREGHSYKLYTYSLNWEKLDLLKDIYKHDKNIPKPKNLEKMIDYACILSTEFDFVRVDLYDTGDKVFFGEMTFTPHGGLLRYYTTEALQEIWKR